MLLDPRFAGPFGHALARHPNELRRSHVPQKCAIHPRSEHTIKAKVRYYKKFLWI
jgi:hypothetical protein